MATVIVREPGRVAFTHELRDQCTLGRARDNDLVLADQQLSRHHLRVERDGEGWQIRDLGSTHGTFVNGRRVEACPLVLGDVVQVGGTLLALQPQLGGEHIDHSVTAVADPGVRRADGDARRLQLLYDVSRAFGALADPEELIAELLASTLDVLDCERGIVGLIDEGAGLRRVARARGPDPHAADDLLVSRKTIEAMLIHLQSVVVRDPVAGARSGMGAPLLVPGRVLGFVYVDDRARAASFTPAELDFLTALSHLAAAALEQARRHRRLVDLADALRDAQPLAEIIGASEPMRRLVARIQRYAASPDASILIRGESGTGKELVARTLHAMSPRNAEPFVAVNCAAIPDTLIEAELFGHERGAFTGAVKKRRGKFAMAHKGTLFLDEIGDLSPGAQAKVLRAIEEGEVQPLGSDEVLAVDVRIVSATHRRLEDEIARGRFRGDLYYRLNVAEIEVPPLRERGDDVVILAEAFLARAAARMGKPGSYFLPEALSTLRRYDWPGNVRQLQNEIERALMLADGDEVDVEDLRLRVDEAGLAHGTTPTMEEAEREIVERALRETGGNIRAAARALGVARGTLYRKISKFKLSLG